MSVSSKTDDAILALAVGVGLYLAYKAVTAGSNAVAAVGATTNSIGNSIGSALYDLFNPSSSGSDTFYTVAFPDGSNHAVNSGTVDSSGQFVWTDGNTYQMYVNSSQATGVNKTAVLIGP